MLGSRELKEKYKTYENKDLIKILRYRKEYTRKAIYVIQEVVTERAIDQEEIDDILDELNEEAVENAVKEEESLTYWEKLLLVCVPILGFVIYLVFSLKNRKLTYTKKIARSLTYSLLGTIIFAIILIVVLYK